MSTAAPIEDVLCRMRLALGVLTDAGLAKELGCSETTVRVWRTRGTVPLAQLARCEQITGRSIPWLRFGPRPGQATPEKPKPRFRLHLDGRLTLVKITGECATSTHPVDAARQGRPA